MHGNNIDKINCDEIFVLLMAAYLHDSGMGISESDYAKFSAQMPMVLEYPAVSPCPTRVRLSPPQQKATVPTMTCPPWVSLRGCGDLGRAESPPRSAAAAAADSSGSRRQWFAIVFLLSCLISSLTFCVNIRDRKKSSHLYTVKTRPFNKAVLQKNFSPKKIPLLVYGKKTTP